MKTARIQLLGDICFDGLYCMPGVFRAVRQNLRDVQVALPPCDYRIGNWECPISADGDDSNDNKPCHRLCTSEKAAAGILEMKLSAVTLANNHLFDAGREGFGRTQAFFEKNGIRIVGAGNSKEQAERPLFFDSGDIRFALINWVNDASWSSLRLPSDAGVFVNRWDRQTFHDTIAELKKKVDHVLVSIHWGDFDLISCPSLADRALAAEFIDAGASAVYGGQQHFTTGYEFISGRPVIYGVGNFLFSPSAVFNTGSVVHWNIRQFGEISVPTLTFSKTSFEGMEWNYFLQPRDSLLIRGDDQKRRSRRHRKLCGVLRWSRPCYRLYFYVHSVLARLRWARCEYGRLGALKKLLRKIQNRHDKAR